MILIQVMQAYLTEAGNFLLYLLLSVNRFRKLEELWLGTVGKKHEVKQEKMGVAGNKRVVKVCYTY